MCTVVLIWLVFVNLWLVFVNLILGVLGLIFSWIGFNRAKKQGLKHRGLALAGLIVAPIALILSAVLFVAVLVVYIFDDLVGYYESHEINEHEIVFSESSYSRLQTLEGGTASDSGSPPESPESAHYGLLN